MKQISAFSCSHCNKIYALKDSCRSHESRCYFNPKTQSCASCRLLKFKDYEYTSGHHVAIRTCLRNYDVTRKMKTRCSGYLDKKLKADKAMMKEIQGHYDPGSFIQPILNRMKAEHEESLRKQRELNTQGHILQAEALIGLLGSAVGYTILLIQEIDLTPEDTSDDDSLERHYEFRQTQVDYAVSRFQSLGISKDRINLIINELVGKFPRQIMLFAPLYKQGEITYHQKMGELAKLYEDTDSESYHLDIVKQLSSVTTTGLIGQFLFRGSSPFANDTPDLNSYSLFLKILEEAFPELKQEIVEGIENRTYKHNLFEIPF